MQPSHRTEAPSSAVGPRRSHPFSLTVLAVLLASVAGGPSPTVGQERAGSKQTSSVSAEELFKYVLAGVRAQREKLRRGSYEAEGLKEDGIEGDKDFPRYSGAVRIFSAFDYDQGLYRFDRCEPQLFLKGSGAKPRKVTLRMYYAQTKEQSIHCVYGWGGETPEKPIVRIWPSEHSVSEYLQPIDVRSLGLGLWVSVHSSASLDAVLEVIQKRKLVSVDKQADGIWRVVQQIRHPDGNISRFSFWFDETRGFSPVRMEVRFAGELAKVFPDPTEEVSVTWTQINNVWLPETVDLLQRSPSLKHQRVSSYRLRFDWKTVNEPLPSDLFTVSGLSELVPDGTEVYDHRLGKPVLVRVIEHKKQPQWAMPPEDSTKTEDNRYFLVVLLNLILIALVGAAWFFTRVRAQRR